MHERSIILNSADVRAILEGKKSQHRVAVERRNSTVLGYPGRLLWSHLRWDLPVRIDPGPDPFGGVGYQYLKVHALNPADDPADADSIAVYRVRPAIMPGDRFWAKEQWQRNFSGHVSHCGLLYRATAASDQSFHGYWAKELDDGTWVDHYDHPFKWRSATSMPRSAARLWVEVISVSVAQHDGEWRWVYRLKKA